MTDICLVTSMGDIVLTLRPDLAPRTVAAFVRQVDAGAYDGGAFWRIVRADNDQGLPPIEIVQAQCKPDIVPRTDIPYEATGIRHEDGTVSLPRGDDGMGSAHSFFICLGKQPALDVGGGRAGDGGGYAAFGRVTVGMDIVRAIHRTNTVEHAPNAFMRGQIAAAPIVISRIEHVNAAPARLEQGSRP